MIRHKLKAPTNRIITARSLKTALVKAAVTLFLNTKVNTPDKIRDMMNPILLMFESL